MHFTAKRKSDYAALFKFGTNLGNPHFIAGYLLCTDVGGLSACHSNSAYWLFILR